ncbi:nucleotidyltransferase domain-containing protein [Pacificimonas sp. ICDLI1SI03]
MTPSTLLHSVLREPQRMERLTDEQWNALIRVARVEMLMGTIGMLSTGMHVPDKARLLLDEAAAIASVRQNAARYEVQRMVEALAPTGMPVVLMKGSAYLMADLPPCPGRNIGDLDIMVPFDRLNEAETALKRHGWQSIKAKGTYDDSYYREWMHELPPLAHETRGGVIDLHHTILPRTARLTPRPERMLANAIPTNCGAYIMAPAEMLLHSATHLAYDGDLQGGARNLWDIDRLVRHFAEQPDFWDDLKSAAMAHDLTQPLARALRLSHRLYGTPSPAALRGKPDLIDRLALGKLRGHDRYGAPTTPISNFILFLRGHWLRMPLPMLTRHLFTKWRARRAEARQAGRENDQ